VAFFVGIILNLLKGKLMKDTSNLELEVATRISKQVADKNVNEGVNDLKSICNCLIELIATLDNSQVQLPYNWYEYYEAMLIKFRLNISSIIRLYEIEQNEDEGLIYHDLSSIYLLNRSLLETYLIFFYSYVLPKDEEEGLMNYYIFKISGLVQRQGYDIYNDAKSMSSPNQQIEFEKLVIEELQNELVKLNSFISLNINAKAKRELIAGKYAKRFSFIELIKKSKLKDDVFADMWRLHSNYAHCELLGLLQINSYATSVGDFPTALYSTLTNTLIVTSALVMDFIEIFKNTNAEYVDIEDIDDELITLIGFWASVGTVE
jgi:hypothetical protein